MNFVLISVVFAIIASSCAAPSSCPDIDFQFRIIDKAGPGEKIQKLYLETSKGLLSKTVPSFGGIELAATSSRPVQWNYDGVGVS